MKQQENKINNWLDNHKTVSKYLYWSAFISPILLWVILHTVTKVWIGYYPVEAFIQTLPAMLAGGILVLLLKSDKIIEKLVIAENWVAKKLRPITIPIKKIYDAWFEFFWAKYLHAMYNFMIEVFHYWTPFYSTENNDDEDTK